MKYIWIIFVLVFLVIPVVYPVQKNTYVMQESEKVLFDVSEITDMEMIPGIRIISIKIWENDELVFSFDPCKDSIKILCKSGHGWFADPRVDTLWGVWEKPILQIKEI